MFNNFLNLSSVFKDRPFSTEKELILYMIANSYGGRKDVIPDRPISEIYHDNAPEEWKKNSKYFDTKHSMGRYFSSRLDYAKLEYLANHCDDEDIIRAVFESGKVDVGNCIQKYFVRNVNIPDDIISKLCELHSSYKFNIEIMQRIEYKYITEETKAKIDATLAASIQRIRKVKEDGIKQKLTAFLTTAAAAKSVLTGNSIDDVVEQTITSDVDDVILDCMNDLLGK